MNFLHFVLPLLLPSSNNDNVDVRMNKTTKDDNARQKFAEFKSFVASQKDKGQS